MGCPYQAPLLVCLPTPVYILYLLTYRPRPMQANKKRRYILFLVLSTHSVPGAARTRPSSGRQERISWILSQQQGDPRHSVKDCPDA